MLFRLTNLPFGAAVAVLVASTSCVQGHITINSPNGGEVFQYDATIVIEWEIDIAHNQQNWDLWYSTDSASGDWNSIVMDLAPGSPTTGSIHTFEWTSPSLLAEDVWVRVRMDNSGTDYFDVSNSSFAIVPAPGVLSALAAVSLMGVRRRSR